MGQTRTVLLAALLLHCGAATAQPQRGSEDTDRLAQIAALEAEGPSSFPAFLNALVQMSTSYANQGRYSDALPLLRRAHEASLQTLGAQHATTEQLRVTVLLMERFVPTGPARGEDRPAQ